MCAITHGRLSYCLSWVLVWREVWEHTGYSPPVLVDENIYHRICKIVHGHSYVRRNLGRLLGPLGQLSPLYAIWRPYKNTTTRCFPAFFPLMTHFMYGKLADGVEIPASRKLIFKE